MSSKIATAILTGGLSLASPSYGRIATLGILGDKSKKPAGQTYTSPLAPAAGADAASGSGNRGVIPLTTTPLGDSSTASLSRGKLLGN